jgi:D-alanyl-D-alanine carboxypeptidase
MNKFFKRMTAVFLAVSTTAASILMPATCIYAAETAATTQNTQAAQTTQNSQNTQTTKNTQEYDWPQAPDIVAQSAILIDADTGAILYEKDAHAKGYPASTTKILTGLLTIENCGLDETVTFSSAAANSVTYEDASLGTKAGEQYSVEQALYGLLLYSANEIAYGLAEHVSGSLAAFTELMNKRAKELGAINTHFANASGLHDVNHYTTAYDMAMIAKGCYNNSTFVNIDSTSTTYTIPPTNKTDTARNFKHRHLMLKGRQYYYEYCKGGKTGFTDQAGYTLVTFAEKDDMRLICVCFKSGDKERFTDTRSLFDWGFANFKKITASGGTISSLFTSDSYYQSPVFNKYNLKFNLKASTLTLPNNASVGNVAMGIDNNYKTTSENGIYTAHLNFNYGNNIVGTAKLTLSSDENIAAASNLPFAKDDNNSNLKQKKCIVINIWIIVAVIAAILIVLYIHSEVKRKKTQRRRYSGRKYL